MQSAGRRSSRERWTILLMTVVLIALCGSLAAIVHDSGTDFTRVFQILVLLLCGSLIGALVSNYLPKSLASSLSGRAGTESESFLRKQQAALWRLTKSTNIHGGVFEEALREATEAAAHTLEVERVSVWLFNENKTALQCYDLFERSANHHSKGVELAASQYPGYFQELNAERVIAAHDAQHDTRTSEFTAGYLMPLSIASLLDAPIQSGGRMVGVICHEHVGTIHEWTLEEQQFANSMANLVSLALEATERLQAELALRKSEERIRSIIDTALDAVIGMDEHGHILDWNRRAEIIFGWTHDEAAGRDLAEMIIPFQNREAHRRGLAHFLRTGEGPVLNKRIEITAIRRDGTEFPIELAISPLKTKSGYEFNAFVQDISERKQAEEELRNAKESAEAANRAKSQFLANMSHEIRTPMNGVLGMTDLMLATTLNSKQRRFAETVRQSGQNLLRIVNEILDFAKVEAGKLALERAEFDVYETVEEVIDLVAERAQAKGLTLACEIDQRVPAILKGDPGRLRQILINLIGNAIKFTERGEVIVRVKLDATSEALSAAAQDNGCSSESHPSAPQCRLHLSVTDTGIGISANAQPHVFEPFAQADGSTTRKYGGTGLGLAIVKQLVEMMNGTVAVQSVADQGSTFSFTAQFEVCEGMTSPTNSRRYDMEGLRVLVVDSNPTTRSILEHQLNAWRMHHGAAESGSEALAFLQHKTARGTPYDLAIVDSQLADMDALSFAREMQQRTELVGVRLIMLSAITRTEDAEAFQKAGFHACLAKPFRQSRLYDCLATVMGGTPEEQAALRHVEPREEDVQALAESRILLAEDNPVNQEVALGMLEALGCHADVVSNGRDALEALARKAYDVVLMDCQMPEMDGFEATRCIRKLETAGPHTANSPNFTRHIPIVALTAHAITGDRERCLGAGMDDYLSKPFAQEQLRTTLLRWCTPRALNEMTDHAPISHDTTSCENAGNAVCKNESNGSCLNANGAGKTAAQCKEDDMTDGIYEEVPSIDPRAWDSIRSLQRPGQPDMLCKVIDKYLTSSRRLIDAMREAVPQRDAEALHHTAHSLKSSSATVGALRLAALCKDMETMGRTNALEGVSAVWRKFQAEYKLVQDILKDELNQVKT